MEVIFTRQFEKELRKVTDKKLARNIEDVIISVKNAPLISDIDNLKKLKGHSNAYRIRIGNYRIGIYMNEHIVEFACLMHRSEIYRYFP